MKQLAKALMQFKSFKDQNQCLIEALDILSFDYPDIYTQLFREVKKREMTSNDVNQITKFLNFSNQDAYVKLHEALILVKNHNIIAKEKYMDNIKLMLTHTIKNRNNIDLAVKICSLIEKSPHLKSIHECLIDLIQQVMRLNKNKPNPPMKNYKNNTWIDHNNQQQVIGAFGQLNIHCDPRVQPQFTPGWPTMLQPTNLNTFQNFPCLNLNCYDFNNFELIATANKRFTFDYSQTVSNQTVVNENIDGAIYNWLHYLKLHKYQWFFNSLSYFEIESIDEDNIERFITKVNRNSITKGAQKKICLSTKTLRERPQKLKELSTALDIIVTPSELCEFIVYMKDILHYPLPNKNIIAGSQLQQNIVLVMEKCLDQLQKQLNNANSYAAQRSLTPSVNKYLECTLLITKNQLFTKEQYEKTLYFSKILKCKVQQMQKNFTFNYYII